MPKSKFTASDVAFLRDHCIKAIKAKSVKAEESNKVVFAVKQDEAMHGKEEDAKQDSEGDKENVENMMEVDRDPNSEDDSANIMIDTTKSMDAMITGIGKKRKQPL